ncbi:MAG: hypothetical protein ACOCUH_03575 [Bacteriovoracia bacterium]
MNLKIFIIAISLLFSSSILAMPEKFEVWFLSAPGNNNSVSRLLPGSIQWSLPLAQVDVSKYKDKAEKVGENLYFHPQVGMFTDEGEQGKVEIKNAKPLGSKYLSNENVNLVDCDESYYFDLYCGKAQKKKKKIKKAKLEIWVDTSSSFRTIDPDENSRYCNRRTMVEKLKQVCDSVFIGIFDTSLKQMGGLDTLCTNHGLNDQDRLIKWINNSDAKHLVVITDISEFSIKLSNFIASNGGEIKGEKGSLLASHLPEKAMQLKNKCK